MRQGLLVLAALACGAVAFAGDDGEAKKDLKALQGTWRLVSLVYDGKPTPKGELNGETFAVTGGKYRRTVGGEVRWAGEIKLFPSKAPREADLLLYDEEKKVTIAALRVIYKVDGDRLELCIGQRVKPEKFESKKGDEITHFVYERVKKKD